MSFPSFSSRAGGGKALGGCLGVSEPRAGSLHGSKGETPGWAHARTAAEGNAWGSSRPLAQGGVSANAQNMGVKPGCAPDGRVPGACRRACGNTQSRLAADRSWASLILAAKPQYFGVANNKKVFSSKRFIRLCADIWRAEIDIFLKTVFPSRELFPGC